MNVQQRGDASTAFGAALLGRGRPRTSRFGIGIALLAGIGLAASGCTGATLTGSSTLDSTPATSPASPLGTTSPDATGTPRPDPSTAKEFKGVTPRKIADVAPFGRKGLFGSRVTGEVTELNAIVAKARGIGEVSGPALQFILTMENNRATPVAIDATSVDVVYGRQHIPATPVTGDPAWRPFSGTLKPRDTGRGSYVFTVPVGQRDHVALLLSYEPASPVVIFSGSAPR